MNDSKLNHIKDVKDLTEEELSELTAEQAKMLRKRFGIDTDTIENSIPVQKATDATRLRIKQIEEKYLSKFGGNKQPPEPEND